jgi:hypothetical protein
MIEGMPDVQKQRRDEWHGWDGFVNSKDSELNPEMLSSVRNLKDIANWTLNKGISCDKKH